MFMCVSTGDPMPSITWFKDGVELDNNVNTNMHVSSLLTVGIFNFYGMNRKTCYETVILQNPAVSLSLIHKQITEWKIGQGKEAKIKSKLEIDPARQMDSGSYECNANNKFSVDRRSFKADF